MTIAEQRITALAQEAHTFAKEAHTFATAANDAFDEYLNKHMPKLAAMIEEWTAFKDGTLDEMKRVVNEIDLLSAEWNDFKTKYLPVIEQHFSGTVAAVSGDAAAVMEKLENAGKEEVEQAVEEAKTTAAEPAEQGIGQQIVNEAVALGNAQQANQHQQQIAANQNLVSQTIAEFQNTTGVGSNNAAG